jgi:single-strand DNA-binding protein
MDGMNKVVLMGTLNGHPIKERTKGSGVPYGFNKDGFETSTFNVATNEFEKKKDGSINKRTDLHTVRCYGKIAVECNRLLRMGTMVLVEGRIKNVNKGSKTPAYEIIATDVSFIANYNKEA